MIGIAFALCTSATIAAELVIDAISQEAPTSWINTPKLDAMLAIQTTRNNG